MTTMPIAATLLGFMCCCLLLWMAVYLTLADWNQATKRALTQELLCIGIAAAGLLMLLLAIDQ